MQITVKAYAKINLMLDILSTLPDGYHDLFMVMQSVGIYDTVTVKKSDSKNIKITCDIPAIPVGENNIAYKAASAFFDYTKKENCGIEIDIIKKIPHAAGLAGGSADAAGVITALNSLFEANLSEKELIEIGSAVGSDVPFCILGGTMLAQYTGTVLSHLPDLSEEFVIIVKPDQSVSTGAAYSAFDSAERVRHLDTREMLSAVCKKDRDSYLSCIGNVFEQFIDVPDRVVIKGIMRESNVAASCMSGSGPSVFGIFNNAFDAQNCIAEMKERFDNAHLCSFVNKGCEII